MRRGLTLVEVICGIGLLGSLLVGLVMASTVHLRQLHNAERRLRASGQLEELLVSWAKDQIELPWGTPRLIAGPDGFQWEARIQPDDVTSRGGLQVVRVRIFSADSRLDSSLASVDLLLPAAIAPHPAGGRHVR